MCRRVAYLHVAFSCRIAMQRFVKSLWILKGFFCMNPEWVTEPEANKHSSTSTTTFEPCMCLDLTKVRPTATGFFGGLIRNFNIFLLQTLLCHPDQPRGAVLHVHLTGSLAATDCGQELWTATGGEGILSHQIYLYCSITLVFLPASFKYKL